MPNTRLFDRTTRSLLRTQAADDAYGIAERILRDVSTLGSNFRDLTEGSRGRVHLTATPATALTLLPKTARRFAKRYANIQLVIDDCAPNQFLPHILSERTDLGLGIAPADDADFVSQTLLTDVLHIVCAGDHALARKRAVPWTALKGVPLIAFRPGYGVRSLIDTTLLKAGIEPNVAHEAGFVDTAIWMAGAGLGVTILPSTLARLRTNRALAIRPLVEPTVTRTLALITKRGRSLSPACRLFADMLMQDVVGHQN